MEKHDSQAAEPASVSAPPSPVGLPTPAAASALGGGRAPPGLHGAAQVLALQRAAGNRAVGRLVAGQRPVAARRVLQRVRGSSDWQAGFNDGVAGRPKLGLPRLGEALDDYEQGWAEGAAQAQTKQASVPPPVVATVPEGSAAAATQAPAAHVATPAHAAPVLTMTDRLIRVIKATGNHVSPKVFEQIQQLLSPQSVAMMAAFIAAQFFGAGEVADAAGLAMLAAKIGADALTVAADLKDCVVLTMSAQTDDDFDNAGEKLADAITLAGVDTLLALLAARGGGEEPGAKGKLGEGEGEGGGKSADPKQPDAPKQSDAAKPPDEAAAQAARAKRLADLANDPDKGGVTAGSTAEAVDALKLEDRGDVPGPVRRANGKADPRENGADFVDGKNGLWDHKFAKSGRGFDPVKFLDKIQQNDIANGEKIMLNHEGLTDADRGALLKEIDARGLRDWFKGIPPL